MAKKRFLYTASIKRQSMQEEQNLIIIGSGPAGYTAAIYAARANLSPILFEGFQEGPAGGQLMTTTDVENYPGFPEGVQGPEIVRLFKKQAEKFGTKTFLEDILSVDLKTYPFVVYSKKQSLKTRTIIIATGAKAKRLDIKGTREGELWQKGVTACAVCDGAAPIFRDKELFVIGGGDSAMEEAIFLTKYGKKVYIVHRRNTFRASQIMIDRAVKNPKIEVIWDSTLEEVKGKEVVESVIVKNVKTNKIEEKVASGVFFAIGHTPNTAFLQGQIELREKGYIQVKADSTSTSVEGVFAAGDVQDAKYRQAITAAGSGCMAAIDAERWLASRE